ncbi:dihydrofolate synthase/folylpolyglutamate synthase [Neisseria sp. HSC-16F19]|nr:bifunctional tetrahydrofolate synthase/dihydrofolate synthase [Neisseria sp. HSC-16F19]MCP2041852.1 dihydrofolate synthase/folylpolyglutamate synthase [Neisseria sp. HSC-16F19]
MHTFPTLDAWLAHLETAHSGGTIDMGLARVGEVRARMNLVPACPLIVVAGTNGKGSTCAYLTHIYTEAGYRVGTLTSPHLLRFNERIAINGEPVADAPIMAAFERIEAARGNISLTYFEFNTLAAVSVFAEAAVDVMVLEVGLGGRLDAVNVFDADVAVITGVDLDHQAYLGDTIEAVAYEKAGVMRPGRPAVFGQSTVPQSLAQHAADIGADLLVAGRDFAFTTLEQQQWSFRFQPQASRLFSGSRARHALPMPALRGGFQLYNAACALAALECLDARLPVDMGAIKRGLVRVRNPGRFQVLPGRPLRVLDVGHNPQAARALRNSLMALPYAPVRTAVFGMLSDKDIHAVVATLKDQFDHWRVATLPGPRGLSGAAVAAVLAEHGITAVDVHADVAAAWQAALSQAGENDRIAAFGSFHTVADVLAVENRPT